jgi:hypothetical protein
MVGGMSHQMAPSKIDMLKSLGATEFQQKGII